MNKINTENTESTSSVAKQTIFRKLISKLFPIRCPEVEELPGYAPGSIMLTIVTDVDWTDLFRLIITRRFQIEVCIKSDVGVNKAMSFAELSVLPPKWTDKL